VNPLTLLGEVLIGLLGSALDGDLETGAADFDLEGLLTLADSVSILAGVNFSGAWDLLLDLPRGSTTSGATETALAGAAFLAVVVLAEVFMAEALATGVIFLVSLTGEVDLAVGLGCYTIGAALDDLLGSGVGFLTDAFLLEAGFLTGDAAFLGDTERWLALGEGCFLAGDENWIGLALTGEAGLCSLLGELRAS
jgi:hypothetical protein